MAGAILSRNDTIQYYRQCYEHVDLVMLDMVMPQMSGREVFLPMWKINPDVMTLLSSGYSIDGEAQRMLDEGVMGFIQKPCDMCELMQKISEALK